MFKLTLLLVFAVVFAAISAAGPATRGNEIFEAYSQIGVSLSQDQLPDAVKHAKELKTEIIATDVKKAQEQLTPLVENLINAKNLDAARKEYEQMSSRLSELQKDLGIQADQYYCSMLKKTWLQKVTKITNPYAGKEMASCGEKKKS